MVSSESDTDKNLEPLDAQNVQLINESDELQVTLYSSTMSINVCKLTPGSVIIGMY